MTLNLSQNVFRDALDLSEAGSGERPAVGKKALVTEGDTGVIPESGSLTGVELRIQKVLIRDNGTAWVWPFIRYSDLYVIVVTIDDLGGQPFKVAIEGFSDVDDGESLPLERTIYLWQKSESSTKPPGQVHMALSVIKSNKGARDLGASLKKLQGSVEYKSVVVELAKAAASKGATAAADVLLALTGLVGGLLADIDDRPLLTQILSFTAINGDFDALGKHVHQKGNRFVDLDVALTVRDVGRAGP